MPCDTLRSNKKQWNYVVTLNQKSNYNYFNKLDVSNRVRR